MAAYEKIFWSNSQELSQTSHFSVHLSAIAWDSSSRSQTRKPSQFHGIICVFISQYIRGDIDLLTDVFRI